jgi:predicted dehydrogenase
MTGGDGVTRIGILGCGDILAAYMLGLGRFGKGIQVIRCGDVILPRSEAASLEYGIPRWGTVEEVLGDDDVDLVVSLTPPAVHASIIISAAKAGKHIYTEKPLAATTTLAIPARAEAEQNRVRIGAAPDTFLGSGCQTARAAIDRGEIGEPIGCVAFSPYSRAERWHPNPGFLFQPGAGPLLDTGPYFVTALVNLLGPVATVAGKARIGGAPRRVSKLDGTVEEIAVAVPTHAVAVLGFASGAIGTFVSSYDIWDHGLPDIEIYGTEGTLSAPHPNWFDGEVRIKRHDDQDWSVVPPALRAIERVRREKVRGIGVVELAGSIGRGLPHRASAELAYHVLEVLEAVQSSSDRGEVVRIASHCERPAPLSATEVEAWIS